MKKSSQNKWKAKWVKGDLPGATAGVAYGGGKLWSHLGGHTLHSLVANHIWGTEAADPCPSLAQVKRGEVSSFFTACLGIKSFSHNLTYLRLKVLPRKISWKYELRHYASETFSKNFSSHQAQRKRLPFTRGLYSGRPGISRADDMAATRGLICRSKLLVQG